MRVGQTVGEKPPMTGEEKRRKSSTCIVNTQGTHPISKIKIKMND